MHTNHVGFFVIPALHYESDVPDFFPFQLQRRKLKLPIPTKVVRSLLPLPSTRQHPECLCLSGSSAAFHSFMVTDK